MGYMFNGCSLLKELNLSHFNIYNVTNMSFMFNNCSLLERLNIKYFYISNTTDLSNMFSGCSEKLKKEIQIQNENIGEKAFL